MKQNIYRPSIQLFCGGFKKKDPVRILVFMSCWIEKLDLNF